MDNDFLITLFSAEQARRSRVIFGLLKNITTVSTLYGGLRYQLLDYIGFLPNLTEDEYSQTIETFLQKAWLETDSAGQLLLTAKGVAAQQNYRSQHVIPEHLAELGSINLSAWQDSFLLANQIVSELSYKNKQYYPLQVGPQLMFLVRRWYYQVRGQGLTEAWIADLESFLKTLPSQQADNFAATWIGHADPGEVQAQLTLPATWNQFDFKVWQWNCYLAWSAYLRQRAFDNNSPIQKLWQSIAVKAPLPAPVMQTLRAFEQGLTLENIASYRRIKIGTVREHLLTAAILLDVSAFPYQRFLDEGILTYFATHLQGNIDQWQFKAVRQSANPMEFFYFRLYSIQKTKEAFK
ncbi:hypothetical protein WOSG25_030380 [Weissella oryzae SG25]|uniref:Helicase Helix-turn-helix domain-containing protein n=1 Tax=Weissella oryzae (strain DSM 25784 / JCM 18191 / LMG 30913 / SG25) TaxID=1329250 RepID=A0A069CZD7_WEIOS|nr:helix-turn-helix domain-containing protein [Weissella oryzae]GAK30441.1 hypothetical protein WOSG25_030380 [Weissella oryzae SG25]